MENDTFAALRERIDTDYFEDLIKKYLIDNKHSSIVILKPERGLTAKKDAILADRLKKYNYKGELTFELTKNSKPGKNTHDIYSSLDELEFLKLAHDKAVKFREMI